MKTNIRQNISFCLVPDPGAGKKKTGQLVVFCLYLSTHRPLPTLLKPSLHGAGVAGELHVAHTAERPRPGFRPWTRTWPSQ